MKEEIPKEGTKYLKSNVIKVLEEHQIDKNNFQSLFYKVKKW